MLNKRSQILFDQDLWDKIATLAKAKSVSIGQLIRDVMREKYLEEEKLMKRKKAIERILKHRPAPVKGKIDYKELINYGRKY